MAGYLDDALHGTDMQEVRGLHGEIDGTNELNHQSIVHQTIHSHYKNTLHFYLPVPAMISSRLKRMSIMGVAGLKLTPDYLIFSINGQSVF